MEKEFYTNPIIYTDYSDPDVCRVGEDYYMVASSFSNAPGLPILHSKDLVNWNLINYAIDSVPGEQFDKPRYGCGVWAPAIRHYAGEYYIFFPMPDEGIYVVKAKNPRDTWSKPQCIIEKKGWIDPCPFWDEDGTLYMVSAFAKSRIGFKSILNLCKVDTDNTDGEKLAINDEGIHIFDGNITGQETIEGPKMYKRNGYYYIFAPAGGVKQGWQVVLRSKNIWGPYEYRVVMEQKNSDINGPHQGAWVDTSTGEDWFIHFQDVYAAGRIVHLQPMRWVDDWPVIGDSSIQNDDNCGQPVRRSISPFGGTVKQLKKNCFEDQFDQGVLGLEWQWNANPKKGWFSLDDHTQQLVLNALRYEKLTPIASMPNLLLRKWSSPSFTSETRLVTTDMQENDVAGMISLGCIYGAVCVKRNRDNIDILLVQGNIDFKNEVAYPSEKTTVLKTVPTKELTLYIRNDVDMVESTQTNIEGKYAFPIPKEKITFAISLDATSWETVTSFYAVAGRWVGVKHGLFCYHEGEDEAGKARFDYFIANNCR